MSRSGAVRVRPVRGLLRFCLPGAISLKNSSHPAKVPIELEVHAMDHRQERKYRRFPLVCPVFVRFEAANTAIEVETISQDVSLGGLLVESAAIIPKHTSVTVRMRIQGEQAVHPIYLAGEGKIVRVEGSRNGATFWIAIECTPPIIQLEGHLPLR